MIYNTTLIRNGSGWADSYGKPLIVIGNQNLYEGKQVWTDGRVIYGYDIPSFIAKKIGKKSKAPAVKKYIPICMDFYSDYVLLRQLDISKQEITYSKHWNKPQDFPASIGVFSKGYFSGSNLWFVYYDYVGYDVFGKIVKWDKENPRTFTTANRSHLDFDGSIGDIGRNGGFALWGYSASGGVMTDFLLTFVTKDDSLVSIDLDRLIRVIKGASWENVTIAQGGFGNINISDEGVLTAMMYVSYRKWDGNIGRYVDYNETRVLRISADGNVSSYDYTNQIPYGDGILNSDFSLTIEIDNPQGQSSTITIPSPGYADRPTLSVDNGYILTRGLNQYDLTGTRVTEYSEMSVTNYRFDEVELDKLMTETWGFT